MNSCLPTTAALNWNCTTHGYMIIEAPPPSQPASSLGGGPPTTSQTPLGGTSGMLLVGVASGITVVLLNVFVIGCCLHKRNEKRLKRGTSTTSLSKSKMWKMYCYCYCGADLQLSLQPLFYLKLTLFVVCLRCLSLVSCLLLLLLFLFPLPVPILIKSNVPCGQCWATLISFTCHMFRLRFASSRHNMAT